MSELPALFETERLRVRRIGPSDEAMMFAVYRDPIAARWVDDGLPIEREEVLPWIS